MTHPTTLLQVNPVEPLVPVLLDSPHSGNIYPEDFDFICPEAWLRQTEDAFVDQLFAFAPRMGIALQRALFARSYIDVNRAEDDIDPRLLEGEWPAPLHPSDRSAAGHGLIRHLCRGSAVYGARIPVENLRHRLESCYRPYHQALAKGLADLRARFGAVWHINCHSMPSAYQSQVQNGVDFVLGDRDGASCEPAFTAFVAQKLQATGYVVEHNDPYKGAEILCRYGRPAEGVHSLQLEINRRLYMDEKNVQPHAGFTVLQKNLETVLREVRAWTLKRACPQKLAAE